MRKLRKTGATVTVVLKRAKRPKPRNSTQIQKTSTVKNGHEIDPPSCSNISRRDCAMLSELLPALLQQAPPTPETLLRFGGHVNVSTKYRCHSFCHLEMSPK